MEYVIQDSNVRQLIQCAVQALFNVIISRHAPDLVRDVPDYFGGVQGQKIPGAMVDGDIVSLGRGVASKVEM